MKARDFKPCAYCGKGVMHTGLPLFYRVRIERMGIDVHEVQRAHGMEQFMGGHLALARVFHDPDIATPLHDVVEAFVCEECGTKPDFLVRLLEEAPKPEPKLVNDEQRTA